MNQTPAAILVLASSILAYSATVRAYDPIGVFLGLAALAIGGWGVISIVRNREMMYEQPLRADLLGTLGPRRQPYTNVPTGVPLGRFAGTSSFGLDAATADVQLSPEVRAQLSMASHLEGRDRAQIVEEALRHYLPRFERAKAA